MASHIAGKSFLNKGNTQAPVLLNDVTAAELIDSDMSSIDNWSLFMAKKLQEVNAIVGNSSIISQLGI